METKGLQTELISAGVFKCILDIPRFGKIPNTTLQPDWCLTKRFSTGTNGTVCWDLTVTFYPRYGIEDDNDHLLLTITNPSPENLDYRVGIEGLLYVLNSDGKEVELISSNAGMGDGMNYNRSKYPFSRTHLMSDRKSFWLHNTLRLVCHVAVDVPLPKHQRINLRKLDRKTCFPNSIDNKTPTDVTLIAENKEFRAHKIFLTSRSPVFAAMFQIDMRENLERRVKIDDISSKTLKAVLQYIYTNGIIELDVDMAELLAAADKYDLNDLKGLCEERLSRALTHNNVYEFLHFADRYNCHRLNKYIQHFLVAIDPPRRKVRNGRRLTFKRLY